MPKTPTGKSSYTFTSISTPKQGPVWVRAIRAGPLWPLVYCKNRLTKNARAHADRAKSIGGYSPPNLAQKKNAARGQGKKSLV